MIIKKKLTLVSTFLILVSLSGAAAFTEEGNSERGFLFGLSLGWGAAGYNEPLQSWIDTINTLPGINHLGIGLGM